MKKLIPFLLAILLLSGCSPAAVERPNTPIPPTATPLSQTATAAPTITPSPTSLPPTAAHEIKTCTYDNGFIVLPGGQKEYAEYFGWTSKGEYYIGADFNTKVVFCFLEEGFTGTISEFDRHTNYYAENVPDQVLNAIGREGLFQVFPTPDGKYYLFIKAAEPPIVKNLNKYDVWLWNAEKQEASILLDAEEDFWRECRGFLPPEKLRWLDEDLLFANCATGDDPNYFLIDIQQKQYENVNDGECYWNEFFRGYTFSPDGKQHLSLDMGGDMWNFGFRPLLIAATRDLLQYYQGCSEVMDQSAGLDDYVKRTKQLPILVRDIEFLNYTHSPVRWSSNNRYLYLVDIESEHTTYGDILKYHLESGTTETVIEFEHLRGKFPNIEEYEYSFDISPSEEFVLIVYPWSDLHILPISDLQ